MMLRVYCLRSVSLCYELVERFVYAQTKFGIGDDVLRTQMDRDRKDLGSDR